MKQIKLGNSNLKASAISLGCMRIGKSNVQDVSKLISCSIENGINFFDHADIYAGGKSEEIFAAALNNTGIKREDIYLQSKCGIRNGFFDFSKEYILNSVDNILKRLNTDYLDVLALHRPDTLFEPEEVAQAFSQLKDSGKVRHFGVSNQNGAQMQLLSKYLDIPLIVNQLQMSCANTGMIDSGFNVNMKNDSSIDHDNSVLEFCRYNNVTIQTWSPLQYGMFAGTFLDNENYPLLNSVLQLKAEQYGVTPAAIAIAWILRHPANMQVIIGTTKTQRITEMCKAGDVQLSREDWYEIYRAAGNTLP